MKPERSITPTDQEWPSELEALPNPERPQRLHLIGRPLPEVQAAVAIVGTRRPTVGGLEAAEYFSTALVQAGFAVISGMAMGIDTAAHRAALEADGHTVAVIGCGLNIAYPDRNRAVRRRIEGSGTVVTEYPAGTPPLAAHFPLRNRIIAAVSTGVLVIEGGFKSGALITARRAMDLGKHVWAVPGSWRSAMATGPNELIRTSQATCVTRISHITDELAPGKVWSQPLDLGWPKPPPLDKDEATLLALLDEVPLSFDQLQARTEMELGRLAMILSRLEVRGLCRRGIRGFVASQTAARTGNS